MPAPTTGVRNEVDEVTVYGEASARLGEHLVASAGGRFTYSLAERRGRGYFRRSAEPARDGAGDHRAERSESAFLPSFSLAANVFPTKPRSMSATRKASGPGGLAIAGDFVTRFKNDHISTLEFGARHGRDGHRSVRAFGQRLLHRWTDIQADFIDNAGLPSTANIGDGHIWSATVNGSVALGPESPARCGPHLQRQQGRRAGRRASCSHGPRQVPNIARFAGRIGFDYQRELGEDLSCSRRAGRIMSASPGSASGPSSGEEQGDYLDTGLMVRVGRDTIGLTLGISNLTDEKGNRFALGTPFAIGRDQITPLRPRTIRLGLDASF